MSRSVFVTGLILALLGLLCFSLSLITAGGGNQLVSVARKSVIKSTGISSVALNSPAMAVNSVQEGLGLYGLLSDIPGGYCYFSDDEKIYPPPVLKEHRFQVEIIRKN